MAAESGHGPGEGNGRVRGIGSSMVIWELVNKLPVWHLQTTSGKQMWESCQRLQQLLEVAATAGSCSGLPARPAI